MKSVNKIILIGTVGKDPEIRMTQEYKKYAYFSLVTTESKKNKQKRQYENVDTWFNVITFSHHLVENLIEPYVTKGAYVYLEGSLSLSEYENIEGKTKASLQVNIGMNGHFVLLQNKNNQPSQPNQLEIQQKPQKQQQKQSDYFNDLDDDEIPF